MPSAIEITRAQLQCAFETISDNIKGLSLEEALFVPPGGYRSVLGTLKHAAGWSHVYRSYAFDASPLHWSHIAWPRGLRDTIVMEEECVAEVMSWFRLAHEMWMKDLSGLSVSELWQPRPLHWGQTAPLHRIVTIIAGDRIYHAGELNQILSVAREEAWEEGEEVEENNVSARGHRVRPPWKT